MKGEILQVMKAKVQMMEKAYYAMTWHAPLPPPSAWGGGGRNFRKVFAGGGIRNFYFGVGLYCWVVVGGGGGNFVGGSSNFEVKNKIA